MTYMVARFYGQSDHSIAELYAAVSAELLPRLIAAGGLQRYGVVALRDGRIGSVSAYDDQTSAERSITLGRDWVASNPALRGLQLAQTVIGERIFSYYAEGKDQATPDAAGVVRVYQTTADLETVAIALEDEAAPIAKTLDGVLRFEVIKLADGSGYAAFTACETPEAAEQFTQQARESRTSDSKLGKAFPHDPEVIEGRIVGFHRP